MVVAGAKITGEDIDQADRPGLTLRVAPGQIEGLPLVDLGDALCGKCAGEVVNVSVTAPAAHPNEQWRDKKLDVAITISQVRRHVIPQLDDAFIESIGFGSLEEVRDFVRTRMDYRLKSETQQAMRDQIRKYLLDNIEIDLPEGVVNGHTARLLQRHMVDLLYRGVPREKIDENITQLQADASEQAKIDLKLQFILDKIAEDHDIQVNEAEINARIAQIAAMNNSRPERVRQELQRDGSLEQVAVNIREDKAVDKLLEQAEITEAKVEPAKAEAKKAKKTTKKAVKKAEKTEDKGEEKPKIENTAKKTVKKTAKKAAKKTKDKTD